VRQKEVASKDLIGELLVCLSEKKIAPATRNDIVRKIASKKGYQTDEEHKEEIRKWIEFVKKHASMIM